MKLKRLIFDQNEIYPSKLNENFKIFNMCITCNMAHSNFVVQLLPNTLQHVLGYSIQWGSDSLLEFLLAHL